MAIGTRGKSRFSVLVLSLFLMAAIVQFLPGQVSIIRDSAASSAWKESSGNDFSSGVCNQVDIQGSGSSAYLTIQSGKVGEVLSQNNEITMGGSRDIFNSGDRNGRSQCLYLASYLTSAGFSAGNIMEIQLHCNQPPDRPSLKDFRIRMQNTLQTTSTSWMTSGWTDVFGPTDVTPASNSWHTFTLTNDFHWDGTSNLMIDLTRDDVDYDYGGSGYYRGYLSNYRMCAYSDDHSTYPFNSMGTNWYDYVPSLKISTKCEYGDYTSKIYHPEAPVEFEAISWNAVKPADTEVKFQLRSAINEYDVYDEYFTGPDGTIDSYYTTSGEEIHSKHKSDQFIQYKAYLTDENPVDAPKINEVTISFNYLPNPPILEEPTNEDWVRTNKPTFSWSFSDIDSLAQSGFQWQADEDDDFGSVNYDSGEVVSTKPNYTPTFPITDGTYYWRVRTRDSDGSWGLYSLQGTVKIDSNVDPPEGIVVTPDEWTSNNMFTVDWTNPTDYSGLKSGAYYYIGTEPPTSQHDGIWSTIKPISITNAPNGENNIYVWLEDKVGNRNCSNYGVAKLKLDLTAPDPPKGIVVAPENWTSIPEFSLDWTNPTDPSGVKPGAYYYLGSNPPGGVAHGVWMARKPFTITKVPEGENYVYIWLEDSLGNSNFLNYSKATIKLDTTPPVIDHIPITSGLDGKDIRITVKVIDEGSGVDEVLLYFKRPTDITYAIVPMENAELFYSATIPSSSVSDKGLEYYIKAIDNSIPGNINYFGINSQTQYEPTSLTDIDIKISSLPSVLDHSPKGYKVPVDNNVTIIFNKSMDMISTENAMTITPNLNGIFTWGVNSDMLTFDPNAPMDYNKTYTVTISRNAKDPDGNYFVTDHRWSFTTQTKPIKDDDKPTSSGGAKKSGSQDDNSMVFVLMIAGLIIIVVLILVIAAIFSKLKPKKSDETNKDSKTTQSISPTPQVQQPVQPQTQIPGVYQQNVYGPGTGTVMPQQAQSQTQIPGQMPGVAPLPVQYQYAPGQGQVPLLSPAQNTQ